MRKLLMIFSCAAFMFSAHQSKAQLDLGLLLDAGKSDATTYLSNYLKPAFRGLGFGMNGGWYNTAKTHKTFGFDLSVSLIASRVPDADEFFVFDNADYENFYYAGGNSVKVPTLLGPNLGADDLPRLTVRDFNDFDSDGITDEDLIRISAPTGMGIDESDFIPFNAVPEPMVQLGVGLIKNTDLQLRYIPEQNVEDDAAVKLFGVGIKHDITQWLPAEKVWPVDLSIFAGYTKLETKIFVDKAEGQYLGLEANSFMAQAIVSKKISVLTPYAGIGYAMIDYNVSLKGQYETESEGVLTDPVDFKDEVSGLRANLGLMIKLGFFTLTGEYAIQEYNTYSVGFGFSFR